ncbi:MAG: long-chain fatty acid--CoA ligase [Ferruginibacter sp.]|nr:long-chain fatty acid--CoA ligase [Ferruginibacter sp.]
MEEVSRLFDFFLYQQSHFPKNDMLAAKEDGKWKTYSTQEVNQIVHNLASGLLQLGLSGKDLSVEEQDKVAIISRNRPEWIFLDLACQLIGVVLVPVYPTSNPHELTFIYNEASVKYIFCSGQELLDKTLALQHDVPSLKEVFCFDKLPGVRHWTEILNNTHIDEVDVLKKTIQSSTCVTIIYTSGTTGVPKGVMLSHHNVVSNVLNSISSFPFERDTQSRALSFLPLNHIFERMITYLYMVSGISIYYAESIEAIGDNIKEIKPAVFCTVPRLLEKVYEKIMAKGEELSGLKKKLFFWAVNLGIEYDNRKSKGILYDLQLSIANKLIFSKWREGLGNQIKYIVTGSAACQVRLLRLFNAARIPVYEGYGPTENSPVISVNRREKGGAKYGTVGPVINGQEVKLLPDGEICVKGPSVMMGYYKRADLTAEVVKDGWLHTGDIGVFEENKFLRITDRKKELFKTSGGKYVAPQPIENKMKESHFIEQMMVVGEGHKFVGALIVPAFTALQNWMSKKGIAFTTHEEAIRNPQVLLMFKSEIEHFNELFNHVEQIKRFELLPEEWTVDTGELTPTLKLKRKVIKEKYKEAIDRIYS